MKQQAFLLIISIVLLSSCQREQDWSGAPDIKATVEEVPGTRTSLSVDESGAGTIYWNTADNIDVFFGTKKATYTSQNSSNETTATFKTSDDVSDTDLSSTNIWGLYPANSSSNCNGSAITTTLPSTQYGVANTFDDDLFPAIAHSTSTSLQFYNVCGGIKFSLAYGDIKKVTFRGNNNENIAGTVSISFVSGVPKATVTNGVKEITLSPKSGAKFVKGTDYYIVLLPGTLSNGFTMTFTTTSGAVGTLNYTDASVTIKRSVFSRKGNVDAYASFSDDRQPNNVIYYTSSNGQVVTPNKTDVFGANIVSNEYFDGKGVITFNRDVTSIGDYAFQDCRDLKSISLPASATSIGYCAFHYCGNLLSVVLPENLATIGAQAFNGCANLTSIEIPDAVTSIGQYAFSGCSGLTSIEIPSFVTSIGQGILVDCSGLTSIVVAPGNTVYDSRNNCNAIIEKSTNKLIAGCMNSIIPNGVEILDTGAFHGCTGLTSIIIPDSVTTIEYGVFGECTGLTSLVIPATVSSIGPYAFFNCGLTSVTCYATTPFSIGEGTFDSTNSVNNYPIYVPAGSVDAYKSAWSAYEDRIQALLPPDNVIYYTSTDGNVVTPGKIYFDDAKIVSNVYSNGCGIITFDRSLKYIDHYVFENCESLKSITLPSGVTGILSYAFEGCSNLESIVIPNGVSEIQWLVFKGCSSLTSFDFPDGITTIEQQTFEGCSSLVDITIPDSVTSIGWGAFKDCSSLIEISIPDGVTEIRSYTFAGCSSLVDIDIPEYMTTIESLAFYGCESLSSFSIPEGVTSIGNSAFASCSNLSWITFPNSVTSIGECAFGWCNLSNITIPSSVTSIGKQAFMYGVRGSITFRPITPPTIGTDVFKGTSCPIYVPAGSVDAYKSSWSAYADRIHAMGEFYEAVDLGLPSGLKWATCNVGASSPEEYGDYFAWGETSPKSGYNWASYLWCNGNYNTLLKYNNNASYGIVDNKTVLDLSDDAAYVYLGGDWRMPTEEEQYKLKTNCTWAWTTQNGVNGMRVTGPNGNSIFFPAAGDRFNTSLESAGTYGDYWSSSLNSTVQSGASANAWATLSFSDGGVNSGHVYMERYYGLSIRPVKE